VAFENFDQIFVELNNLLRDLIWCFCSRAGARSFDPFTTKGSNERAILTAWEVGRERGLVSPTMHCGEQFGRAPARRETYKVF
jgi:hypothetical protein